MARKSRFEVTVTQPKSVVFQYSAGIYKRLSVEDGDDEEQNSLGNQKKIILNHLLLCENITVYDEYSDNGYTGMNFERPGFKKMLRDLHDGKINCVIIKDISRLGRHFLLTSELVERTFPELGIRLISVNDGYDSINETADASSLVLPLKMVMNDYYVRDISRKIRSSIQAKMDNGEYLPSVGSVPYGYLRVPEEGTFIIDEEAAPIADKIFRMKAERMSINAICRYLNVNQIPSPGRLRYMRGLTVNPKYANAIWCRKTVRKILEDLVYTGNRIHGRVKRERLGLQKKRLEKSQWQIIPDAHKAIVSAELFDIVQQIFYEESMMRKQFSPRAPIPQVERDLFRGMVFCADCGAIMSPYKSCGRKDSNSSSWIHFECNRYVDSHHLQCEKHYINQADILRCMKDVLNQQFKIALDVESFLEDVKSRIDLTQYRTVSAKAYADISSKRKKIEAKIEHLITDLTEGVIDREEYVAMKEKYAVQYELALSQEAAAKAKHAQFGFVLSEAEKWMKAIKEMHALPKLDRGVVEALVQSILISKGGAVKIVLNFADPYETLLGYIKTIEEAMELAV